MAKRNKEEITCTAIYTEGCGARLTEALVELYYNRKKYGEEQPLKKEDKVGTT